MLCPNCQAVNPDDGRFCASCRAVLPAVGGSATVMPSTLNPRSNTLQPLTGTGAAPGRMGAFAGRYELLSILGKGGMGVVYRAKDLELEEEIALKLLQPQYTSDPEEVARLKREIITARKITHPNVIRIHDFGIAAAGAGSAGGEAFISMELLPGGTLAEKMTRPIPLPQALAIGAQICEGLAAAHEQEVIHRDLKPQNVIFDKGGHPKLVDFGIARLANATSRTVGYAGTPHYMSPEQAGSKPVTAASDLYSMGVVLFELTTGSLPFNGDSLVALALAHATEPPPSLRSRRADVPADLDALVSRMLSKLPADRPASAAQVASDLRTIAAGKRLPPVKPASVTPPPLMPSPVPRPVPAPGPAAGPVKPRQKKPLPLVLLAVAGLGVASVAGFVVLAVATNGLQKKPKGGFEAPHRFDAPATAAPSAALHWDRPPASQWTEQQGAPKGQALYLSPAVSGAKLVIMQRDLPPGLAGPDGARADFSRRGLEFMGFQLLPAADVEPFPRTLGNHRWWITPAGGNDRSGRPFTGTALVTTAASGKLIGVYVAYPPGLPSAVQAQLGQAATALATSVRDE